MSQGPLALEGDQLCPCTREGANGKSLHFSACCGQYLEGDAPAPDAHSLMRSRYSAFVLQREAYLLATWHTSTRPVHVDFDTTGKWLGLALRNALASSPTEAEVEVEFVARFKPAGASAWRLHERSRFVLQEGRWWYVDGVQRP